ncbi:ABC transporter permease [Aeromicrobium camelliae]|uniref:ABC transporter permease n=1 Tax=Aeromicrobium camelliae TaxID=1538144 RepID=A0A3N6WKJ8_9ACTN|nr:ABC transporter permease [Aeromicrobium camelliae]RQN08116.1 ABC transporter permease [Aeromicrobium camelliae]
MSTLAPPRGLITARPGFGSILHAEWVKLRTVRSTWWTLMALVVVGAGLTTLICALNAEWLASPEADESPGSFITFGMMLAPAAAVVLGVLTVTAEYGSGMIRSSFAAVPSRARVFTAKAVLLAAVLFVVGTATALLGYVGGNAFLEAEGIGVGLEGDVLRSMFGSGLYLAGLGVLAVAVGFLVRHTAGAVTILLTALFVLPTMVMLVPGETGQWINKLLPSNTGGSIAAPVMFNPNLLDPWVGFAVFLAEVAVVVALAGVMLRRRDA